MSLVKGSRLACMLTTDKEQMAVVEKGSELACILTNEKNKGRLGGEGQSKCSKLYLVGLYVDYREGAKEGGRER